MWLLDVNLPNGLLDLLRKFKIECDTTVARGWRNLENGELAKKAFESNFIVILTRDKLFGNSASKALTKYPSICIVILTIPQSRQSLYLQSFESHWNANPILPMPGQVICWPDVSGF